MLRIALASPPVSGSVDTAMPWIERFVAGAAAGEADIVCFPEFSASVGYSLRYQEAATALISAEGTCLDHLA